MQTISVFVQVNFDANKFQICAATNNGKLDDAEWGWVFKEDLDIENFHIKSAVVVGKKLCIFSRGRPRNVLEQCCSFLLIFNLKTEGNLVTGVDPAYTYIKLDPTVYPQFLTVPFVEKNTNGSVHLAAVQENNYGESFPRQIYRCLIPDQASLDKDCTLVNTSHQQLIDMEFDE